MFLGILLLLSLLVPFAQADRNAMVVNASDGVPIRKYAPQFDATIIKGSGHYPMLEQPAAFNQALAEILKKLPPSR